MRVDFGILISLSSTALAVFGHNRLKPNFTVNVMRCVFNAEISLLPTFDLQLEELTDLFALLDARSLKQSHRIKWSKVARCQVRRRNLLRK